MSLGVGCNMLIMILLRVYVYQVNDHIWVCVLFCLLFIVCGVRVVCGVLFLNCIEGKLL